MQSTLRSWVNLLTCEAVEKKACDSPHSRRLNTINGLVHAYLDGNEEQRRDVLGDVRGSKRALLLQVEAFLGRSINPGTLDRAVRRYKEKFKVVE